MRSVNLVRFFPLFALILVILAGLALGTLVHRHEVAQLERMAEERNASLAQVFRKLTQIEIAALANAGNDASGPQRERLRKDLTDLMRESDVVKLKVYDLNGITLFSTQESQVGENQSANPGFIRAKGGRIATELTHRDHFSSFDGEVQNIDLVSSYVPVKDDEKVIGVFELYQNVTPLMRRIGESLWQMGAAVSAVLGALYLLLVAIVLRSQKILLERDALLGEANRELDQRVLERTVELRKSEARLKSLSEMSSDFFWETDSEHRFIHRSLTNHKQHDPGLNSEQLYGMKVWDLPIVSGVGTFQALQLMRNQKPIRDMEISRRTHTGKIQHLLVSADPQFDESGAFVGFLGVGSDITRKVEADAALRISDAAFEAQDATMVTDADSVIIRVNQAFVELTGYTADEVIGQTPIFLRSDRHDSAFYKAMWHSIHTTGHWRGEVWDRKKSGEVYPKWLTISAVTSANGVVTHYIGTHFDISDRKKAEEKIAELAFFDPLTGLPNRTLLGDRLRQSLTNSHRDGNHGAALFIDLDLFKVLNDTKGHAVGDLLLQQVGERLKLGVREGDTVARQGGDEFVVILSDLAPGVEEAAAQVKSIGRKLLDALATPFMLETHEHQITASIGATLFSGTQKSIDDILKQADLAMYKAKDSGRNAMRFFDPLMQQLVVERSLNERAFRQAVAEQQFVLYYQPFVNADQRVMGVEALVRWNHPERGLVAPGEFITLAEETGLIVPLGSWVLESACQQIADWQHHPRLFEITVSVNVSAVQFRQEDFTAQVLATLERTAADPTRLKLELTESLLIDNVEDVIFKMNTLRAIGVQFSLDDFGTGYSSLAYLSRLPFDQVKIDRSFVRNIETNDDSVAICAAIVSLGHSLKLKVVAEGVETQAQRYFLSTVHKCDLLQGFLFSRPLAVVDFEEYAHTH